jgi:hypothetical protein
VSSDLQLRQWKVMSTPRPDTNSCYPYSIAVVLQIYNIVILASLIAPTMG